MKREFLWFLVFFEMHVFNFLQKWWQVLVLRDSFYFHLEICISNKWYKKMKWKICKYSFDRSKANNKIKMSENRANSVIVTTFYLLGNKLDSSNLISKIIKYLKSRKSRGTFSNNFFPGIYHFFCIRSIFQPITATFHGSFVRVIILFTERF